MGISVAGLIKELNSHNQRTRARLKSAVDARPARPEERLQAPARPVPNMLPRLVLDLGPRTYPFLLHLGSLSYMLLGVFWTAALMLPPLGGTIVSLFGSPVMLPIFEMPHMSPSAAGPGGALLPELNLYYLVPLSLAALSFIGMDTVFTRRRFASAYLTMIPILSGVAAVLFLGAAVLPLVLVSSALAEASAVTMGLTYLRRQ